MTIKEALLDLYTRFTNKTQLTRMPYLFLGVTLASLLAFASILFVPLFSSLLWDMMFVKFTGNLIISALISTFTVGLCGLMVVLNDNENTLETAGTSHYANFYISALLKWTSLLFLGLMLPLSLISQFAIGTPIILSTTSIVLAHLLISAAVATGIMLSYKYLGLMTYQHLAVVHHNHNTTQQHITQQHITQQLITQQHIHNALTRGLEGDEEEEEEEGEEAEAEAEAPENPVQPAAEAPTNFVSPFAKPTDSISSTQAELDLPIQQRVAQSRCCC
jgi:hypothetical protein